MDLRRELEWREPDAIAEWLNGIVRRRQRTVWTGRGASFALAQSIASVLRELSIPAYSVPSSDVGQQDDALLCVVSRSGVVPPACRTAVLLAEEGISPPEGIDLCLAFPNPDGACRPWFPLRYLLSVVETFMAALDTSGLIPRADSFIGQRHLFRKPQETTPDARRPGQRLEPVRQRIIVVGHHATPLQTLLSAAGDKVGQIPFRAMDLEEVGHGFHAQLCLNPESFEVLLVRGPDNGQLPWEHFYSWCQRLGVPCQLEDMVSHHPASAVLEAFAGVVALLQQWCGDAGILMEERPIPGELDSLRHSVDR